MLLTPFSGSRLCIAVVLLGASVLQGCAVFSGTRLPDEATLRAAVPAPEREFRAAWVATVANIDWPSAPGLAVWQQQAELRTILDRAAAMGLNAIVLQVRPTADAFYDSPLEPWSWYLSGKQGTAPSPPYDPLAFAIEEAHRRGLELHAWFNPYRALHPTALDSVSALHVWRRLPDVTVPYGELVWMDPGSQAATEQSLAVMLDVVRRYDVDGIHLDDYFYPYPVTGDNGQLVPFPDSLSFSGDAADRLPLDDWRRRNVDTFIRTLYEEVKAVKPWVKVGISPFGIWRPGYPASITGFDQYEGLFADARKWLREGWIDYFSPQLYWAMDSSGQSYPKLLDWWIGENVHGRHIWPGNYTSRVILDGNAHWDPAEIVRQIRHTRSTPGATGNVHFSMRALMPASHGMGRAVAQEYASPALIPASPWLDDARPEAPLVSVTSTHVAIQPQGDVQARWWSIHWFDGRRWDFDVIPAWQQRLSVPAGVDPEYLAVRAVSRTGIASLPSLLRIRD
ncbi:MAG: hypothetical protein COV99_08895 [Bacteroidetes bacterium CG12_big_fil_rev_8_21_14_0_65_60_17]|nr:MAG: hypothetical protein COV99_08895 [Bacteroidetes bacterium CG12_big_fil_rev_8_21_14_0_65_60_17]